MALLLVMGAAGLWAWRKANSAPSSVREQAGFWAALRYNHIPATPEQRKQAGFWADFWTNLRCKYYTPATPEQRERNLQAALKFNANLLTEFPALRTTAHPVPAEKNAFLLLQQLQLAEPPGYNGPAIRPELRKVLAADEPWNPVAAQEALQADAGLVARIEHIASLTTRSSENMPDDYRGFIASRAAKYATDILLLKARLAAEQGDENETLRLVASAQNLASDLREVEAPNLFSETVTILVDKAVHRVAFQHLLPSIGRKADLGRWKSVLSPRGYTTADLARVMRGEWKTSSEYLMIPFLSDPSDPRNPPDGEALMRAFASCYSDRVSHLPGMTLAQLLAQPNPDITVSYPALSQISRDILSLTWIGPHSWEKGYVTAVSAFAQYQAAFELLESEKDGKSLTPELTAGITRDPVSGLPFIFNPATRTLSPPAAIAGKNGEPLKLPW
jgi:hypothetical protein